MYVQCTCTVSCSSLPAFASMFEGFFFRSNRQNVKIKLNVLQKGGFMHTAFIVKSKITTSNNHQRFAALVYLH